MAGNIEKTSKVGYFYVMTRKVAHYLYLGPCSSRSGKRDNHTRFGHKNTGIKIILRYLYSWLGGRKLADNSGEMNDRFGEIKSVTLWNKC